jgi:putative aldouronate transport system permease protein
VIAVVGLFYAVMYWNVWFDAVLYIDSNAKRPIQQVLQSYLLAGQTPNNAGGSTFGVNAPPTLAVKMAVVMVAVVPIVAIYPFIQRHFIKGVLIGAIKG